MEVTRLHHSIQAAINRTITSLFERKLPRSNVTKPSRKLNSTVIPIPKRNCDMSDSENVRGISLSSLF